MSDRAATSMADPFCMVSFVANVGHQQKRFRLDMMTLVAAQRFLTHPCACQGCQEFTAELISYGRPTWAKSDG